MGNGYILRIPERVQEKVLEYSQRYNLSETEIYNFFLKVGFLALIVNDPDESSEIKVCLKKDSDCIPLFLDKCEQDPHTLESILAAVSKEDLLIENIKVSSGNLFRVLNEIFR